MYVSHIQTHKTTILKFDYCLLVKFVNFSCLKFSSPIVPFFSLCVNDNGLSEISLQGKSPQKKKDPDCSSLAVPTFYLLFLGTPKKKEVKGLVPD